MQTGSLTDVSQLSFNSDVAITQKGTNVATVSQGRNADGTGGHVRVSIQQTDRGDAVVAGVAQKRQNVAAVSQSGTDHQSYVNQSAINAKADIWQKRDGVGNRASIAQGLNNDAPDPIAAALSADLAATIHQSGKAAFAQVRQDGTDQTAEIYQASTSAKADPPDVQAEIVQAGAHNHVVISQAGTALSAIVSQKGVGTETMRHSASITQSGDRHIARVVQTAEVRVSQADASPAGRADVPFARSAGSHAAEAVIIQTGGRGGSDASFGNFARIEQRGAGQYARIEQDGRDNYAGILQHVGAANAVAVIEQTGNANAYYIAQDAPGQYLRVQQTGSGNVVASRFGPANAGGGEPGGVGGTVNPFIP